MTNELLEQWRKEAKSLFWYDIEDNKVHQHLKDGQQIAYIEGCKATHEKMLKLIEDAHKAGWGDCIMREYISNYESFLAFKVKHNIS